MTYNLDLNDKFIKYIDDIYKDMDANISTYRFKFYNGYEVSVIKRFGSYGYFDDLWEVALMKDNEMEYKEIVGYDVLGYLTDKEVNIFLQFVKCGLINYDFYRLKEEFESVF